VRNNHGTLQSGVTFAPGVVEQAFNFGSTNNGIKIPASPSLNVGAGNGLTIEAWINPTDASSMQTLVEWNNTTEAFGTMFWISVPTPEAGVGTGPGSLFANLVDTAGGSSRGNYHVISSAPGIIKANTFQHVAVTYDKTTGDARLYLNGAVVAAQNLGIFTPQTTYDLFLGKRNAFRDSMEISYPLRHGTLPTLS